MAVIGATGSPGRPNAMRRGQIGELGGHANGDEANSNAYASPIRPPPCRRHACPGYTRGALFRGHRQALVPGSCLGQVELGGGDSLAVPC